MAEMEASLVDEKKANLLQFVEPPTRGILETSVILGTDAQPKELASSLENSNESVLFSAPKLAVTSDGVCQQSEPVTATAETHDSLAEDFKLLDFKLNIKHFCEKRL